MHVAQSLCLDIGAASNIYLSVCNQKDSQKWYFENIEWDGDSSKYKDVFKLHNVQAGGDCLVWNSEEGENNLCECFDLSDQCQPAKSLQCLSHPLCLRLDPLLGQQYQYMACTLYMDRRRNHRPNKSGPAIRASS